MPKSATPYEIGFDFGRTGIKPEPPPWFCGAELVSGDPSATPRGIAYSEFCAGECAGTRAAWLSERQPGEGLLSWHRRTRS